MHCYCDAGGRYLPSRIGFIVDAVVFKLVQGQFDCHDLVVVGGIAWEDAVVVN